MSPRPDVIAFALDRSARRFDADGRMHVAVSNISKAAVNPYYGREIPDYASLGLDAETVYQVFRPPEELAKAAPTFNNIPLMDEHIIVSADEPQKDRIVGSTGTDAEFVGEYLRNSLVIWDRDMIDRIESGEQKEISCAYRYNPVLEAGAYKNFPFSIKMLGIVGNHSAFVPKGRAGPDVVVADNELETAPMPKRLTSKKALLVRGAVAAYVRPFIAADAKMPDLVDALQGVNRANFKASKAKLATRIAKDAKLDEDAAKGLTVVLDAMDKEDCDGEDDEMSADDEPKPGKDPAEDEDDPDDDDDDMTEAEKKAKAKKAAKDKAAADAKAAKDAEEKAAKDKKAMDAAIADAVTRARTETIAQMNAIATAKTEVMPFVGEITAAMDSAEDVYKFALDHQGVELDDVPPSAYRAMVKMLRDPAEPMPRIAQDASTVGKVDKMFPGFAHFAQG